MLAEASIARGRQNEPAVEIDPRDPRVIIGSSNDYAGVYAGSTPGNFVPAGPIWLGYYRSENGGTSFLSSLVPGYPGDTSPYAALAKIRTASAGDPVIAWDLHGRVFMGAESSDDPAGSLKTFGDVWVATYDNPEGPDGNTINDGKRFVRSVVVAKGSRRRTCSASSTTRRPSKSDRSRSPHSGNVYFSWSRFTGNGGVGIYFSRSTDHGKTWSKPMKLTPSIHDVQFPDIAVTGRRQRLRHLPADRDRRAAADRRRRLREVDRRRQDLRQRRESLTTFIPYDAQDRYPDGLDGARRRRLHQRGAVGLHVLPPRHAGALRGRPVGDNEYVYIVYDPTKPGTQVDTGTTYGSVGVGDGQPVRRLLHPPRRRHRQAARRRG